MTILSEEVEQEIIELVKKMIEETQNEVTKDEIKEVINSILPDIDELISVKVKQHFIEIAEFIKNKFQS